MSSLYDRISKGTMTVDEITESMRMATSEGGKFYQSMEKQSQTLNGQLSTLKDNADQLLGSLTEGVSEGLRDQILPFANNLVGELQTAFETGGYQGLVDTATDMIPDLLGMMTGELQDGIAGLTRWLPQGATKLMQALPAALRAGTAVVPQITNALFEVASVVVSDLVGMLPELVPALVEGFADTFVSVLNGVDDLITGLFRGVEQAFHQGQTKIAGVWVDDTAVAEYKFDLTTDITPAETAIEGAYSDIRAALATDLLTDPQKEEIEEMIGDDYDDIKAKLLSFGLPEQEAAPIATAISSAGDTIRAEISKLNLGVDSGTVLKWISQAKGSRIMLESILKSTALDDGQQQAVVGVFTDMTDNINGQLPDVVSEIYDTLTNGKAADDDPKTLKEKLDEAFGADIAEVELWLQEKIGALDTESSTYASDVAALTEQAGSYKTEIELLHGQMAMLVDSLAGQPTEVVEARMAEFAAIEARLAEINAEIDATSAKAKSAEEAAFKVVRSGAQADSATISQAITFKVNQFKVDEQSAEDAYNAAVQELNMQLANDEISQFVFDSRMRGLELEKETAINAAREAFEKAMGEIFSGIAEAEGNEEAIAKAMDAIGIKLSLQDFYENMFTEEGTIDTTKLDALTEQFATVLGDAFNPETVQSLVSQGDYIGLQDYLDQMAGMAESLSSDELKTVLSGKLGEAWQAALDSGVLEGTSFDTTSTQEQLTALYTAIFGEAAASAKPSSVAAVSEVAESATTTAGDVMETGGEDAGGDFDAGAARGITNGSSKVITAVTRLANSAVNTFKNLLGIQSPSKVMMELGEFTGQGYAIGLESSMRNAVAVAKRMTGQIVTAADITQTMRVSNMPNIQQDITLANEQIKTPVYLDGQKIAEIQGYNNSTQLAWQNTRAAKGVGSR